MLGGPSRASPSASTRSLFHTTARRRSVLVFLLRYWRFRHCGDNIQMEVESNPEPSQEPPPKPETQVEPFIPSSVPNTNEHELEGSDEEEEHIKAQAQALRDYQLARDRV
ncbi:hypothetical protein M9H77_28254 [Catharanthus roseus]|uniref:Uncharacterized protein n=1 Tax=Catharanthus roseus TaxID=4058 RepID=A0ACC0AIY2_CATRO|nr:hypothetical protein M9H77_28254 [Catharanthus roseus]